MNKSTIIDNETAMNMVIAAKNNLKKVYPDHDPLHAHRPGDEDFGGSSVFKTIKDIEGLQDVIAKTADYIHLTDNSTSDRPAKLIVIKKDGVGKFVENTPISGHKYRVAMGHGELQLFGDGRITETPANEFTIVLTPEKDGDNIVWVLASAYPGLADSKRGDFEGLNEGDLITGDDAITRGIPRVKPYESL